MRVVTHNLHVAICTLQFAIVPSGFLAATRPVSAQTYVPLRVEVDPSASISRSDGPIRLGLHMAWGGAGIFDGRLLIEVRDSEDRVQTAYRLDDLYLSQGVQHVEVMLPASTASGAFDEYSLRMTAFDRGGKELGPLRPAILRIPGGTQRSLVIAVCRSELGQRRRNESDLADALRLDNLLPDYELGSDRKPLMTRSVDVPPGDMPVDPLRLCAFDLLLLGSDALPQLDDRQLAALLGWVRAGGSLFVLIGDESLKRDHVGFLNALSGAADSQPDFLFDSTGRGIYRDGEPLAAPLRLSAGLGAAAVLVTGDGRIDASAGYWPATSAFLWRLRSEHLPSIATTGRWSRDKTIETARRIVPEWELQNYAYAYPYPGGPRPVVADPNDTELILRTRAADLKPAPINGGTGFLTHVMPSGIKVVPLWLIALVLLLYVAVIGPLEYLVLGAFRARKYTWFSFPALTLGFTLFSIVLSNYFMHVADHRQSVIVRDLIDGGRVARENRFELLFTSSSRSMETDVTRGLFSPLRYQDYSGHNLLSYGPYGYPGQQQERRVGAPLIVGRMPSACDIVQAIPQWTPQLNRLLTIPLAEAKSSNATFDWDAAAEFSTEAGRNTLRDRINAAFGRQASIYLYHGAEKFDLAGPKNLFETSYAPATRTVMINGQWTNQQADFLHELCVRPQPGYSAVVWQVAPSGGDRFEDLALLDPTDDSHWLLVVAVREGEGTVLYRRLYHAP
jgi:hypothetical protein